MIDRKLIRKCQKGETRAQYELYKLIYQNFMGLCMRYRRDKDKAQISLNNGFAKIIERLSELKDVQVFEAWVRRVLVNDMLNELKKEQREQSRYEPIQENLNGSRTVVENKGFSNLKAADLRKMLGLLPVKTQHVFNLFAIDGFTHAEIGQMLEISIGTSKWHVAEARKQLKKMLQDVEKRTKVVIKQ